MLADQDIERAKFLCGVVGLVEATRFEHHSLWLANRQEDWRGLTWVENNCGYFETVGYFAEHPICVSLITATVDDHKLLFYHTTSLVVHHDMVREWLEANMPSTARLEDGRLHHTDAMNFHNIFRRR